MRRIREALRLHLQAGLTYNEVGRALKISKSVVGKYVSLARVAGVDCDVADGLDDAELESRLYRPAVPRASHQLAPDFGLIHQELKRPGVTLMLLWEEYANCRRWCRRQIEAALRPCGAASYIAGAALFCCCAALLGLTLDRTGRPFSRRRCCAIRTPCAPVSPACLAFAGAPPVKGRCGARVLGCACGPRQRLRFLP